jgi:hypothetical protein
MRFAGISKSSLSSAVRWLTAALVLCALGPSVQAWPREAHSGGQSADELADRAQAALGVLRDGSAAPAHRQDAARTLIDLCDLPQVRSGLSEILSAPLTGTGGGNPFLSAVARVPDAPARLFPMMAQRLAVASPGESVAIIEALGSFRSREAAHLLGRYIGPDQPPPVAAAALASLARLSARDDLGVDRDAWGAWLREVEAMSEPQWRLRLIAALAARNDRLAAERRDAVSQLTDSLRRLHLATKPEDRPALLASLLEDAIPQVRDLGFELVARELSATGHLDGPVGMAALKLLSHPDPAVRSNAAVLVRQLAPAGADKAVAAALSAENDASAASDLLLAAARWPTPAAVAPVLRWIQSETPAADAATEAAWCLLRAGDLDAEASRRVLAAVRRVPTDSMFPAGVSLLAALGEDEDRERLVPLLSSQSASLRQAAGEALIWYPRHRAAILAAAASDPDLFDIASRAVVVNDPTAHGLRSLLALPQPSPELARAAIMRVANRVPAADLRMVIGEVTDPTLKRDLLSNLLSPERLMSERDNPPMMAAIAAGACDLAELELVQARPEAALAALDAVANQGGAAESGRATELRCTADLALGRVEYAERLNAGAESWLRGLEMARGAAAAKVLGALEAKFTDLESAQKARLEAVRARIKAETPEPAPDVGPPVPP